MSKKKWTMKQYWRVLAIRGITGTALWTLVLGGIYYQFIPELYAMGFLGAIILSIPFLLLFLVIGYVYDSTFKLWNEQKQVVVKRNPYQFVPRPKDFVYYYPVFLVTINTLEQIGEKFNLSSQKLKELRTLLHTLFRLNSQNINDLRKAETLSMKLMEKVPFGETDDSMAGNASWRNRLKLAFSVQLWRLSQIQNLWGIFSDTLVVAGIYIVYLPFFPDELTGIGVVTFGLIVTFILAGWVYDRRFKLWSPLMVVTIERNIYTYVAKPHDYWMLYPLFLTTMNALEQMIKEVNGDLSSIRKAREYLQNFFNLSDTEDHNIKLAIDMSKEYSDCFVSKGGE